MSSNRPYPPHAPPARPISEYVVMSWHWFGPDGAATGPRPPPGAPVPPAPAAAASPPAGGAPRPGSTRRGGGARPEKIRGELTIAAFPGSASGTLITSRRNLAVFGSSIGPSAQPGSSSAERTRDDPDT